MKVRRRKKIKRRVRGLIPQKNNNNNHRYWIRLVQGKIESI
jgi:hypothetical protein